ncbi:MAG: 2-octaprenyl-3-methyl-6-methoxy,4-benzoquinol hydroxylase [Verrucomicrobiaceae bacterium]|nr:2-octaprenyl-3-methyl-6-methoxy,4-benzoquinol hydroxylase [Verrucomicrobiaceae bacterium]
MIPQKFDVVIVGAGLAGTALAVALGGSTLRVALIEAQPLSLQWPALSDDVSSFDARVSALTLASQQWLQQLGAWNLVAAQRTAPYRHMQVWDGEGTGFIEFDAAEVNQPALGHIVENRLLQVALLQSLSRQHNVQIFSSTTVERYERDAHGMRVHLNNQAQLVTTLLVGADGANSRVRDWAQFKLREWDYGHIAIVATVATEQPHAATARQIFRRQGPLAFLPLRTNTPGQHLSSIVWSTLPEEAEALMQLDDAEFMQTLGRAFEHRLGAITATSTRFSFPLRARHASDYVQPNIALIGDAAHTIHPLAGQGINLGFLDAQALAQEVLRAAQRGLSVADESVLSRYQRSRKTDNLAMLAVMEGFKRLFGARQLPLRWLRNSGLKWVNRSAVLKRILIRQAMGAAP